MVQQHLQSHVMALALPCTMHPVLAWFLRRYGFDYLLDHVVKWVWDNFGWVSRAFYRDIKNIETDFGEAINEID